MRLSAAQKEAAGAVSKITSDSMRHKEVAVLALKLERWHEDDRAQICYRALYKSKDEEGIRLIDQLSDLDRRQKQAGSTRSQQQIWRLS